MAGDETFADVLAANEAHAHDFELAGLEQPRGARLVHEGGLSGRKTISRALDSAASPTGEYPGQLGPDGIAVVDEESQQAELAGDHSPRTVGVLVVHGIGEQRRGTTLLDFGEALYRFMRSWLTGAVDTNSEEWSTVELSDTTLARLDDGSGAPPHLRITAAMQASGAPTRKIDVIVAEAWWAEAFPVPSYGQVAGWLFGVAPWVVQRQLDRWLQLPKFSAATVSLTEVVKQVFRETQVDEAEDLTGFAMLVQVGPALQFVAVVFAAMALYLLGLVRLLLTAVSLAIGLLFQACLLGVAVVSLFPRLRRLAVRLQVRLAAGLGDSYVLVASPVRYDAMVSQVVRDLRWLGPRVDRVVLVGHSQGAAIARQALARAEEVDIPLLVTAGAGIAKLHALRQVLDRTGVVIASWVIRLVAATILIGALLLAEVIGEVWFFLLFIPGLVAIEIGERLVSTEETTLTPTDLELDRLEARGTEWEDYYTRTDPVPDGPLPGDQDGPLRSAPIVNRNSILGDHTSYWANTEGFLAPVAFRIGAIGGWDDFDELRPDDRSRFHLARSQRARRGWWIFFGQLVAWSAAISVVAAISPGELERMGGWISNGAAAIPGLLPNDSGQPIVDWLEWPGTRWVAGWGLVALVIASWYRLTVVASWQRLQTSATGRLLSHEASRRATPTELGLRVALLVLLAVPAVALVRTSDAFEGEYGWLWFVGLMWVILAVGFVLLWRVAQRST